jgi:hypothetical protein
MVKLVYLNGFWILIAIGAFVVGRTLQVGELEEQREADSRGGARGGVMAGGGPGNEGTGGTAAEDGRRVDERRGGTAEVGEFGGVALSPEAMRLAVNSILADGDPVTRQRRFAELMESVTAENVRAAVEAIREAPRSGWTMYQELGLLTYAWGRLDGPAAAEFALSLEGRSRFWTTSSVLSGWANENPDEAKAWVAAVEDPRERANLMRGLVTGLAQKDVGAATEFVYSLAPDTSGLDDMIESVARRQLALGLDAAATWSADLPDGELKGDALRTVAREYVRSDPAAAAAWLAPYMNDEHAGAAIAEVSEEWAERDVEAALTWVTKLPAGENRSRALSEAVSEWASEDPVEAGEYVAELPAGDERDAAIGAYARRVVREDPEAAMEWAASIEQEDLRNETITDAARDWMRQDVVAASAWLEEAQLPDEMAAEILRPSEGRDSRWRR